MKLTSISLIAAAFAAIAGSAIAAPPHPIDQQHGQHQQQPPRQYPSQAYHQHQQHPPRQHPPQAYHQHPQYEQANYQHPQHPQQHQQPHQQRVDMEAQQRHQEDNIHMAAIIGSATEANRIAAKDAKYVRNHLALLGRYEHTCLDLANWRKDHKKEANRLEEKRQPYLEGALTVTDTQRRTDTEHAKNSRRTLGRYAYAGHGLTPPPHPPQ